MINLPFELTGGQQKDLQSIANSLSGLFPIERIICFGTHISITERESCFVDSAKEFKRKYYLLIIYKEARNAGHDIQAYAHEHYPATFIITISSKAFVKV